MNNDFDNTEVLGSPRISVRTKVWKFNRYSHVLKEETHYIVGEDATNGYMFEYVEMTSNDILFRLMKLWYQLDSIGLQHRDNTNQKLINDSLTDAHIKLILKFCKKNGLPCVCAEPTENVFAENTPNFSLLPVGTSVFCISSFIVGLYQLRFDFLEILHYYNLLAPINKDAFLSDHDRKIIKRIKKNNKPTMYTAMLQPFTTYWSDANFSLQLSTNNLMHTACYYLCILCQSGVTSGGYIRTCKRCGALFVGYDSRQKYCGNPCNARNAYIAIKRHLTDTAK